MACSATEVWHVWIWGSGFLGLFSFYRLGDEKSTSPGGATGNVEKVTVYEIQPETIDKIAEVWYYFHSLK
jgi:hypothetical protein